MVGVLMAATSTIGMRFDALPRRLSRLGLVLGAILGLTGAFAGPLDFLFAVWLGVMSLTLLFAHRARRETVDGSASRRERARTDARWSWSSVRIGLSAPDSVFGTRVSALRVGRWRPRTAPEQSLGVCRSTPRPTERLPRRFCRARPPAIPDTSAHAASTAGRAGTGRPTVSTPLLPVGRHRRGDPPRHRVDGPGSRRGALYRRRLRGDGSFEKCERGLPEWFPFNLDTAELAASADEVVLGTADGRVLRSADVGATWELTRREPPARDDDQRLLTPA